MVREAERNFPAKMSIFAAFLALGLFGAISPSDVREDLDSHPWHPEPAIAPQSDSPSRSAPAVHRPAAERTTAATGSSGTWQLQLGAFQSQESAAGEKKRIEKILGAGTVETAVEGGLHKLRYGRFASRAEADQARSELESKGVKGASVLRP